MSEEPQQTPPQESSYQGSTSRWVDYNSHELLDMISQLEDERRWSRLREAIWLALLAHVLLISFATWIPKYIFKVPQTIDPIDALKQRKDLTYLDVPPDALKQLQPKVKPPLQHPLVDKKTLDDINKMAPPPAPKPPAPEPQAQQPPVPQTAPQLPAPAQQTPSPYEAPRPQAVPAKPSFAFNNMSQSEMLKDAMRGSHNRAGEQPNHPSYQANQPARSGTQILTDTQGVDFSQWLQRFEHETYRTWQPLWPDELNPPISKRGIVQLRVRILANGRVADGGMMLEGRSGDSALDRAAWGAITGSNYPALPHDFKGPYIDLRVGFYYNMDDH